jgi:hypothetical protein
VFEISGNEGSARWAEISQLTPERKTELRAFFDGLPK